MEHFPLSISLVVVSLSSLCGVILRVVYPSVLGADSGPHMLCMPRSPTLMELHPRWRIFFKFFYIYLVIYLVVDMCAYVCMYVCMHVYVCVSVHLIVCSMHIEVRGQLNGVGFLFLSRGSGNRTWVFTLVSMWLTHWAIWLAYMKLSHLIMQVVAGFCDMNYSFSSGALLIVSQGKQSPLMPLLCTSSGLCQPVSCELVISHLI